MLYLTSILHLQYSQSRQLKSLSLSRQILMEEWKTLDYELIHIEVSEWSTASGDQKMEWIVFLMSAYL